MGPQCTGRGTEDERQLGVAGRCAGFSPGSGLPLPPPGVATWQTRGSAGAGLLVRRVLCEGTEKGGDLPAHMLLPGKQGRRGLCREHSCGRGWRLAQQPALRREARLLSAGPEFRSQKSWRPICVIGCGGTVIRVSLRACGVTSGQPV